MQDLDTNLQGSTWTQSSTSPLWTYDALNNSFFEGLSLEPVIEIDEDYQTASPPKTKKTVSVQVLHNTDWDQRETSLCEPSSFVTRSGIGYGLIFSKMFAPNVCFTKQATSMKTALLVQVLIGHVSSYPRLLIQGKLPPYIYPSCVLNGRLPGNCVLDGVHRCLSESLATCASLVGMFYAAGHSTQSRALVWKLVYSELDRIQNEVLIFFFENIFKKR
jgi:hypothetical protein